MAPGRSPQHTLWAGLGGRSAGQRYGFKSRVSSPCASPEHFLRRWGRVKNSTCPFLQGRDPISAVRCRSPLLPPPAGLGMRPGSQAEGSTQEGGGQLSPQCLATDTNRRPGVWGGQCSGLDGLCPRCPVSPACSPQCGNVREGMKSSYHVCITFRHITFGRTPRVLAILTRPLHVQRAKDTEGVNQTSCGETQSTADTEPACSQMTQAGHQCPQAPLPKHPPSVMSQGTPPRNTLHE